MPEHKLLTRLSALLILGAILALLTKIAHVLSGFSHLDAGLPKSIIGDAISSKMGVTLD